MQQTIRVCFVLGIVAYPFVVYFGLQVLPPGFFGLVLVALLAMRWGVLQQKERTVLLPTLLVFMLYAVLATIMKSTTMLLYYPVLVNLSLCFAFLASLRQDEPLLLRIVRAQGKPVSKNGPMYLYRLTAIWALFFAVNAALSIWTTTMSMSAWTLYNGLISYLLAGALVGGEIVFRGHYKRRAGSVG